MVFCPQRVASTYRLVKAEKENEKREGREQGKRRKGEKESRGKRGRERGKERETQRGGK